MSTRAVLSRIRRFESPRNEARHRAAARASAAVVVVHSPSTLEGEFVPQPHVEPANSALGRVPPRTASRRARCEPALWLFHWRGKWMFGDAPGVDAAVAFIESAAVTPCDFAAASPRAVAGMHADAGKWHVPRRRQPFVRAAARASSPPTTRARAPTPRSRRRSRWRTESRCRASASAPPACATTPSCCAGRSRRATRSSTPRRAITPRTRTRRSSAKRARARNRPRRRRLHLDQAFAGRARCCDAPRAGMSDALRALRVDQVDLVLIHHPACLMRPPGDACEGTWEDTWRALERLYAEGYARAIGVCNFDAPTLARPVRARGRARRGRAERGWTRSIRTRTRARSRPRAVPRTSRSARWAGRTSRGTSTASS